MDEITSWTNVISDAGMAGAFIVFLVYDRREQAKRMDEYVNRLLEPLANIEKEREAGFETIRDRYDQVIEKYDRERDKLLIDISGKIEELSKAMHQGFEEIERHIQGGS